MTTKVSTRRFSYQEAQRAQSLIDEATAVGKVMSMAEALRRAEGDQAGADAAHRELEQADL